MHRGNVAGVFIYTLTGSLDVNSIVSSVFQKELEKRPVGRSHKSRKDKSQKSVLINASKKMLEHDTQHFSELVNKYRHTYG